jgi:hypothetical protein
MYLNYLKKKKCARRIRTGEKRKEGQILTHLIFNILKKKSASEAIGDSWEEI